MGWTLSTDAAEFLRGAGPFLAAEPVANTALLTEASYLAAHPAEDGRSFAWLVDARVHGALVHAPRHPPLFSRMPATALTGLAACIDAPDAVGIDAASLGDVLRVWPSLQPRHRLTIHEHASSVPAPPASGAWRVAGPEDRGLLHGWFAELMAAHPEDSSDRAHVVDDPLSAGGIVLWESGGRPVAWTSSSPVVADMVRLGPVHAPGGTSYEAAVLHAAVTHARRAAAHVVVLAGSGDVTQNSQLAAAGFRPAAERVLLARGLSTGG